MNTRIQIALAKTALAALTLATALGANAQTDTNSGGYTPPGVPVTVNFWTPTNGQSFAAPADIPLQVQVSDTNIVRDVVYWATLDTPGILNWVNVGYATNTAGIVLHGEVTNSPFGVTWSGVTAGKYILVAYAADNMVDAPTPPTYITVTNAVTPPPVTNPPLASAFTIRFLSPTNNETYSAGGTIILSTLSSDTNDIATVAFFANSNLLGVVSNVIGAQTPSATTNYFSWSGAAAGSYILTALATDTAGNTARPVGVTITVQSASSTNSGSGPTTNNPLPPASAFTIRFLSPTNNETYSAGGTIILRTLSSDTNDIATVAFFANSNLLGVVSNVIGAQTPSATTNYFSWSGVGTGSYILTALATDTAGNTARPIGVTITVQSASSTNSGSGPTTNNPPPASAFTIRFLSPTNNETYSAGGTIILRTLSSDTNDIATVAFFANSNLLGVVSNVIGAQAPSATTNYFTWSGAAAGSYILTAQATDTAGNTARPVGVTITVQSSSGTNSGPTTNNPPPPSAFTVQFLSPTNNETYSASETIILRTLSSDTNDIATVAFFANSNLLGVVSNMIGAQAPMETTNYFSWSGAAAGSYILTALATDTAGNTARPVGVTITVQSSSGTNSGSGPIRNNPPQPTNALPLVAIYATDPMALWCSSTASNNLPPLTTSNYWSGTNTATFLVQRSGVGASNLYVYYSVGGTASNGVDYAALPEFIAIPAGQHYALVTINPLGDGAGRSMKSIVLTLLASPAITPTYVVGAPDCAGAIIASDNAMTNQAMVCQLPDRCVFFSMPATNGLTYCLQGSTNLVDWAPVCTNMALKGSVQFLDPAAGSTVRKFYLATPAVPPAY